MSTTDFERNDGVDDLTSEELEERAFGPDPRAPRRMLRGLSSPPDPAALTAARPTSGGPARWRVAAPRPQAPTARPRRGRSPPFFAADVPPVEEPAYGLTDPYDEIVIEDFDGGPFYEEAFEAAEAEEAFDAELDGLVVDGVIGDGMIGDGAEPGDIAVID